MLDTPRALDYRDGYNAALPPEESGPGAGTKAKDATARGQVPQLPARGTRESWSTKLCHGGSEGLRDSEDEQGLVRWDVTHVNTADALSGPIKQVLLSSQHP